MVMKDKTVKLYVDMASWDAPIEVDDFIVTEGKATKSNSVYHVAKVRAAPIKNKRAVRYHVECYRSDLMTCCSRDKDNQKVISVVWYNRNKKKK